MMDSTNQPAERENVLHVKHAFPSRLSAWGVIQPHNDSGNRLREKGENDHCREQTATAAGFRNIPLENRIEERNQSGTII